MSKSDWTTDKLMSWLVNNKSDKSRWDIIQVLRKKPSKDLLFKCIEFAESKDPKIRIIGIDILAQLGTPPRPFKRQILKLFFDLIKIENDPKVLRSLFYAIGHNNDKLTKVQVERLCSFADNSNNLVKEGLVFSLLGVDNLKAVKTLIKLSTDKISHIRNWATFGIGTQIERSNKDISDALWNRTTDKHQETKLEAIVGLAKRKDSRINERIKKEIRNGEYGTLLFEAILETGDKEFLPLLRQNLKSIKNDKEINPEWIKDLKTCIRKLTKMTKGEKRTIGYNGIIAQAAVVQLFGSLK